MAFNLNSLYFEKLATCSLLYLQLSECDFSQSNSDINVPQRVGYVCLANSAVKNEFGYQLPSLNANDLKRSIVHESKTKLSKKAANSMNRMTYTSNQAKPTKQMFVSCVLDGAKTYMCTMCTYRTNDNSNMHKHTRGRHGDHLPSYKCSTCDFATPDKPKLKNHYMKVHSLGDMIAKAAVDATPISE